MAMPLIKPTIRKIRFPDELTAASALLPRKFPTIRESAVLYNCWNRFPRNNGIAKKMIFWEIPVSYYTSDAADEQRGVDLGGRRIIKKKKKKKKKKQKKQKKKKQKLKLTNKQDR